MHRRLAPPEPAAGAVPGVGSEAAALPEQFCQVTRNLGKSYKGVVSKVGSIVCLINMFVGHTLFGLA